jgi:hypothetical protein
MGAKHFSTEAAGLPAASAADVLELSDGDVVDLRIAPVAKQLGDDTVRMLAYNGSIPGPTPNRRVRPAQRQVDRITAHTGAEGSFPQPTASAQSSGSDPKTCRYEPRQLRM